MSDQHPTYSERLDRIDKRLDRIEERVYRSWTDILPALTSGASLIVLVTVLFGNAS